jgi:predicted permease
MSPRLLPVAVAAARAIVRLVLFLHPRQFRRRFGGEILDDVTADVRARGQAGISEAVRAGLRAVGDSFAGLAVEPGSTVPPPQPADDTQENRDMRTWLRDGGYDVRLGVRAFARERTFTLSVIGTLALGIGVNAAMFGIVDRLLLRGPDHVRDPNGVRRMQMSIRPPGMDVKASGYFPYADYETLRREGTFFTAIAGYSVSEDGMVLGRGVDARRINRGEATANLFPLLGVTPRLGRFFSEREDDVASPEKVVVLGYGLWQREFGGRDDVIGKSIALDNAAYTIVGVAPRGFTGPGLMRVDVWLPESLAGPQRLGGRSNWTQAWNAFWLSIVVRLKPDVSAAQADAEATAIHQRAYAGKTDYFRTAALAVRPLTTGPDGVASMESRVSPWLLAVSAIVLLVSCANVVNLVLARAIRRRREIAVRLALGAGRGRLVRLLVAETLTLAVAGGAAGLAVAYGVGTAVRAWLIPGVEWAGPVDVRVLAVCTAASVAAGLIVGVFPALRASAPDVFASLKAGAREGGGRRSRARAALTVLQAALCALLLVGSGLFVVSLMRVRAMDLGLEPDRVLTFSVQRAPLPPGVSDEDRQRERARRLAFYPAMMERLRQRPDVEAASLAIGLAFTATFGDDIRVPGRESIPNLKGGGPFLSAVSADYFRTVGTRLVRGRGFTEADRAGSAPVAIVNETMAATLWPSGDAIGQCFFIGRSKDCATIVGIVANSRQFRLEEDESMAFFIPFGQEQSIGGVQLLVRPRGDAASLIGAVRQELVALDPTITFVNAAVLQDRVDPLVRPWRLGATMFTLMGALALVVAAVGLYSVMSYFVTDRSHEIGVRMALGARPSDVARLVVGGGMTLAASGVVAGFVLALLGARFLEPLLFHTSPRDPGVFAVVAVTLLSIAFVATLLPAIRARRVNPVEAMRAE